MLVYSILKTNDKVTTNLEGATLDEPCGGNIAVIVFLVAENVRPIERQLGLLLSEESPRGSQVPYHLVVLAFLDVRAVAERVGDIALDLEAKRKLCIGIQRKVVTSGIVGCTPELVGGMAVTPIALQVEASPFRLITQTKVGIIRSIVGDTAVWLLALSLIHKSYTLGKAGSCASREIEPLLPSLLITKTSAHIPVAIHIHRISLRATSAKVVKDGLRLTVIGVAETNIARKTEASVPSHQPKVLAISRFERRIAMSNVQWVAIVGQRNQTAKVWLSAAAIIIQFEASLALMP